MVPSFAVASETRGRLLAESESLICEAALKGQEMTDAAEATTMEMASHC